MGDWYSWEHGSFASFSQRFDPAILHQLIHAQMAEWSNATDCKSVKPPVQIWLCAPHLTPKYYITFQSERLLTVIGSFAIIDTC